MRNWSAITGLATRYLLSGGTAAVVDICGFALGLRAGLPLIPAATLSFMVAAAANYLISSWFVFRQRRTMRAYLLFLAVATLGLVLNVTLTALTAAHTPLPPVAAKVVAIVVSFAFNFTLNVLIVFRPRDEGAPPR